MRLGVRVECMCVLDAFWMRFGSVLDAFWKRFGCVLDAFWIRFGCVLDAFWMRCGCVLDALSALRIPQRDKNALFLGKVRFFSVGESVVESIGESIGGSVRDFFLAPAQRDTPTDPPTEKKTHFS